MPACTKGQGCPIACSVHEGSADRYLCVVVLQNSGKAHWCKPARTAKQRYYAKGNLLSERCHVFQAPTMGVSVGQMGNVAGRRYLRRTTTPWAASFNPSADGLDPSCGLEASVALPPSMHNSTTIRLDGAGQKAAAILWLGRSYASLHQMESTVCVRYKVGGCSSPDVAELQKQKLP